MYPPASENNLRMLRQLRANRLIKRRVAISKDERDEEEPFDILDAVTSTPYKPLSARATTDYVEDDAKENLDPVSRLLNEYQKGGSKVDGRKRGISDVEDNGYDAKKTARTRRDSTASQTRADARESDSFDSFHAILARHSADRSSFKAFKCTISMRLLADLGDFVNASSDEDDPFTCDSETNAPEDERLLSAADALTMLASEPLEDDSDCDLPFDGELGCGNDDTVFETGPSISTAPSTRSKTSTATDRQSKDFVSALKPSVLECLTEFINNCEDGDEQWSPAKPVDASPGAGTCYRVVQLGPESSGSGTESDADETIPPSISAIRSTPTVVTTPSSILRRRTNPPTPISERKHVRFSKKNIRQTCSSAANTPSLSDIGPPSPSSSAPMTHAALKRAQQARQARIDDLESSKFCKIIDEYNLRCQLCKLNIALGIEQVYDLTEWREHIKGEEHAKRESARAEKRAARNRLRDKGSDGEV